MPIARRKRGFGRHDPPTARNEDAPQTSEPPSRCCAPRHIVILANLREEVVALIAGQSVDESGKRASSARPALEYAHARDRLLKRLANGRGVSPSIANPAPGRGTRESLQGAQAIGSI